MVQDPRVQVLYSTFMYIVLYRPFLPLPGTETQFVETNPI